MHIGFWWESRKERDLNVGERIILRWFLDRMGWYGLDSSYSGWGPLEGSYEHGNKLSGSIKCWEILEKLHN
jgi:hypothetical protein